MKKKLLAILLCISLLTGVLATTAGAAIVPDDAKLEVIRTLGILIGDTAGNLNYDKPVTRAQFTKMMVAASPYQEAVALRSGSTMFKDVPAAHWANGYIHVALEQNWLLGYVDGTFRPEKTITLEEACTALLRVLGYDASTYLGAYPTAQLSKAESVGLRDDLSCQRGHIMTRRECGLLLYNALVSDNAAGQPYGSVLGCTVKNGEIDQSSLVQKDTKGPFVSKDGSVNVPFTLSNVTVLRDGKAAAMADLKAEDVYYYHANLRTIWAYSEKVTGILGDVSNGAVTVENKPYVIATSEATYDLSGQGVFRKGDVATVLLGKNNDIVAVRQPSDAERNTYYYQDSPGAVAANTEGPFVVENGKVDVPFSMAEATIIRNGKAAAVSNITESDVYYYHKDLKTVWLYSNRATGTLTAISPNRVSPATAVVSGTTYAIDQGAAMLSLSSQGTFRLGDRVTLLLGMNDEIVRVLPATEAESIYYGVVISNTVSAASTDTGTAPNALTQNTTQVTCTDGVTRTFYHNGNEFKAGTLVSATARPDGTQVATLSEQHLYGAVNGSATAIGTYALADDAEILDTDSYGNCVRVYPSRLAGCVLQNSDVRYYTTNAAGKIDRMILNQATGDMWNYCFITDVAARSSQIMVSASYAYYMNGVAGMVSGSVQYPVKVGGAAMVNEEGKLKTMKQLQSVALVNVADHSAVAKTSRYTVSDNVQYLLRDAVKTDTYYATKLDNLDLSKVTLTGWYDSFGCAAGGQIRIIVATPKEA